MKREKKVKIFVLAKNAFHWGKFYSICVHWEGAMVNVKCNDISNPFIVERHEYF